MRVSAAEVRRDFATYRDVAEGAHGDPRFAYLDEAE